MTSPFLQAENLSKSLTSSERTLQILETINLTFSAASTNAIVGASGSGKTTLLGLLAGLDLPTSGRIMFQGQDITRFPEPGGPIAEPSTGVDISTQFRQTFRF